MKKLVIALGFLFLCSTWVNAQAQKAEPPYNMSEIAAYSIFSTSYTNNNYQKALKYGRWIVLSMPEAIKGYPTFSLPNTLSRFITIYTSMAKKADKPSVKAAYIDTVQTIFTKIFKRYSKDEINLYDWKIRQGYFYQNYSDIIGKNAMKKAVNAYMKAYKLNPEKIATDANGYYLKILLRELADRKTQKAQKKVVAIIGKTEQYANKDLKEYFDDIRQQIFDKPSEQIAYLKSQLKEKPENLQALRKLRDLYTRVGKLKKAREINKKLYRLDPTYQNIVTLANFALGHANYQQAVVYLNEAIDQTDDPAKSKKIYLSLSRAHLNLGNLQQAARYAREAANIDPDWGRPYLKLATIYARAVNNCAQGRDLTRQDRAVYWLVLDYVLKAKRVDPSVSGRASTLLQTYRPVAPSEQDVFFEEAWEKGGTITIDASQGQCYAWIDETTTVRVVN